MTAHRPWLGISTAMCLKDSDAPQPQPREPGPQHLEHLNHADLPESHR